MNWVLTLGLVLSILIVAIHRVTYADSDADCKNVLIVYLRGSGQNADHLYINNPFDNRTFGQVETESAAFFSAFKQHLDSDFPHVTYKAVTIHDFPGKYDDVGYKAVPVGWEHPINSTNAEASWFPGDYQNSVLHGIEETVGYLKDQAEHCQDQIIAVGGYSQGAQVMGESLFKLSPEERSKIVGVGLFGDPKYIGSHGDSLINPFDKATSYPWRRGDATNKDTGMLDPRVPYVPDDLAKRTVSYCNHDDPVCAGSTGWSGLFTNGHKHYPTDATNGTVNEIMHWAAPQLARLERQNGGTILTDEEALSGTYPDSKGRNVLFLINDDTAISVIQTLRYNLDQTLQPIAEIHPNTLYSIKAYGEQDDGPLHVPRIENVQSFTKYLGYSPADPMGSVSNLANAINKRYPFGQPHFGAGDLADPHGLAVERAVLAPGWQDEAEKHIVLFTDRPIHTNYSYNICHDSTRALLQVPRATYNVCAENIGSDSWPSTQHPEFCETVYLALTKPNCTNPIKVPSPTQMINRTLDDAITVAQSKQVAIDVVVPRNIRFKYDTQTTYDVDIKSLEYFSKATGGKFIYYDKATQYNQGLLSDTLYQVFGHTPKPLVLAYKDALDVQGSFNTGHVLGASTDRPIILDASRSNQSYDHYQWDFNNDGVWDETSPGPVTEHQFTSPTTGFIRIAGTDSTGAVQSETRLALDVAKPEQVTQEPIVPTAPDVTGTTAQNGDITLSWEPNEEGTLLAIDPESHLPVAQAPTSAGTTTFTPEKPYSQLEIRLITDDAISDAKTVIIAPYTPPVVVEEPPVAQQDPDPTLCYKLQQCQDESAAPDAYNPQEVSTRSLNNTQGTPILVTPSAVPVAIRDDSTVQQTNQPSVQGTSTEPKLMSEATPQVEEIVNQTKRPQKNYHLQQIGLGIFILGGFFLLYRIIKLR